MEDQKKDELLAYFMGQTNERLVQIEAKLVELIAFRAEVKAEAKSNAIFISALIGIIGIVINYLLRKYVG